MSDNIGPFKFGPGLDPKTIDDALSTLRELRRNLASDPGSWVNSTLDEYLEAMSAWLEDAKVKVDDPPSWALVVMMLEAARAYE